MGKISSEQFQALTRSKLVTLQTPIESVYGYTVSLLCYIIPTDSPRKWVLVTAVASQISIGFVEGKFSGEFEAQTID